MVFPISPFTTLSNLDRYICFQCFINLDLGENRVILLAVKNCLLLRNVLPSLIWIMREIARGWFLDVGVSNR